MARWYGSINNRIMESDRQPDPEVGMGATELCYSDRHAYTVVEVTNSKTIVVQRDKATRADQNGMSDSQEYTYAPDPNGERVTLTLRRDGMWKSKPGSVVYGIGYRDEHYDFSF
jgi:hypothetical protein